MTSGVSLCGIAVENGRYLVARRNPGGSQGGKWEFPGGKAEPGESSQESLQREFLEELGVRIDVFEKIYTGAFSNGPKHYILEAWNVLLLDHEPILREHQELRWCELAEVLSLDLSDSDRLVAEFLRLQSPRE